MSRKTLLTEAEVRQFLKLANIGPVGTAKIEEMYSTDDELEERGMPPGMRDDEEEPGMRDMREEDDEEEPGMRDMREEDDEMDAMADMDDAADDMDDAAMDMDAGADAGGQMVSVDDFMGALERALEDVLGDEVEVDMDDEEAGADPMDMGDEPEMDMGGDDDEPMMEADDEAETMDEEAIVNEVARRVANRLQAKQSKENMVEELAEKILQRITSK